MESITNMIKIESNPKLDMSLEGDFFGAWVEFLKPLHNLTKSEMGLFASFLKERYRLSKVITSEEVLDSVLMSREVKSKIRLAHKMSPKHFLVVLHALKSKGVIVDNKIRTSLIPTITPEGAGLMIYFSFKNEQRIKLGT